MESDVHGYGNHAGPPYAIEHLQILSAVLHGYPDARAARQPEPSAQSTGNASDIVFELRVGDRSGIGGDGETVWQALGDASYVL